MSVFPHSPVEAPARRRRFALEFGAQTLPVAPPACSAVACALCGYLTHATARCPLAECALCRARGHQAAACRAEDEADWTEIAADLK